MPLKIKQEKNEKNEKENFSALKESFEEKIDIVKNDFECLINLAQKLGDKIKDEKTNNDNMIKQFKKYETIESDIVKLNVGGTLFSTLKSTLTKQIKDKDGKLYLPNMFESMVNGFVKPKYDENKAIFIDRNPKYFGCIIDYLRMANTDFEYELSPSIEKNDLLKEAKFYNIQGLIDLINLFAFNSFNSLILNNEQSKDKLYKICEFSSDKKLDLIYRATRDGFSANNFHTKCDNVYKTLTIIKTTNNFIFGGYTEQSWGGNGGYKNDPNAFLFSFNRNRKAKISPYNCTNAIYSNSSYGPTFSNSHDLHIANNSNLSNQNYSNLSYYSFDDYQGYTNSTFLAGSRNFTVSEIEVYSIS